jgi:predicted nucleic acid-binding protein
MDYVIDACAVASLALVDEDPGIVDGLLGSLKPEDALKVPELWWYELANILVQAKRRNRITEADAFQAWNRFCSLEVMTDERAGPLLGLELIELAERHGLSAYDAAYLELAMRSGATLLTRDGKLRKAATTARVEVLP